MKKLLEDHLNKETLTYFEIYLLDELKKNKLTVNNIIRTVKDFLFFLEESDLELNTRSIKKYLSYIEDSFTESSFITKVSAVRQFVNWINIKNNPFLDKDFIFNRTEIDYFREEEFEKLFETEEFNYKELIMRAFYELHLSLAELKSLKLKDFNKANSSFKVRSIKIKCSERLAQLCQDYLKKQRETIANQAFYSPQINDPFFIKEENKNPDQAEIQNIDLSDLIRSFGLSLNKIKRSRIINLIKQAKSDEEIRELLAVKISNFYDQFKPKQDYRLLNAYANFHPRSKR